MVSGVLPSAISDWQSHQGHMEGTNDSSWKNRNARQSKITQVLVFNLGRVTF